MNIDAPLQDTTNNGVRYNRALGLSEENMRAALNQGLIFTRGCYYPAAISSHHEERNKERGRQPETNAELELRKIFRTYGLPTRTSKTNRNSKDGNRERSVALIGYGYRAFTQSGFLIVNPAHNDIQRVYEQDVVTGTGNRKILHGIGPKNGTDVNIQRHNLLNKMKKGIEYVDVLNNQQYTTH